MTTTGALLALVVVVGTDLWVYFDAQRIAGAGTPVFFRLGTFTIDTPLGWFLGCVVLWVVFFPTYIVSRSHR